MSSRVIMSAIAMLLISSVLMAGAVSREGPEQETEPNVIGKVLDAKTETPLAAHVSLHGSSEQSWKFDLRTDDQGIFRAHVPPGKVFMIVESEGYFTQRSEHSLREGGILELRVVMEKRPVDDVKDENVFGHMMDLAGNPVSGTVIFHNEKTDGIKVRTDGSGMFKVHLAPGEYRWKAVSEGFHTSDGGLEVPREGEVRIMINLEPLEREEPVFCFIAGMVTDLDGEPIGGAQIIFMSMEPIPDEDGPIHPEREMIFDILSERDGSFKIEIPPGLYMVEVHMEGFHPYFMEIALTPEHPEAKAHIEMERMEEEEPWEEPNIRMFLEMTDEDSDGNPERIFVEVHVNEDDEPDLVLEMTDENSDGDPDSVRFHMDLPKDMIAFVMMLLKERMGGENKMPPLPDMPYPDDREMPYPDEEERSGENDHPPGWDEPGQLAGDMIEEDGSVLDQEKPGTENTVSDKGSGQDDDGRLPAMMGAAGVIVIIISAMVLGGYIYRLKKKN